MNCHMASNVITVWNCIPNFFTLSIQTNLTTNFSDDRPKAAEMHPILYCVYYRHTHRNLHLLDKSHDKQLHVS